MARLVSQVLGALREKPVWCAMRCGLVLGALVLGIVLIAVAEFLPASYDFAH